MTKLKNTKKGMAKKALSISLVAAMLATSNVPVWAAEDLFSDGSAAVEAPVVEEPAAEVDTFSAEPVEETNVNNAQALNVDAGEINTQGYVLSDLKISVGDWDDTVTVSGSITDKGGNEVQGLKYIWLADGVQAANTGSATGVVSGTVDTISYTPTKDDFNKTLSVEIYQEDGAKIFSTTITGGKVKPVDLYQTGSATPDFTGADKTYNGKEKKIKPVNADAFVFSSQGITSDQITWSYTTESNDFTNVTGKDITVIGTLEGTYDKSSSAYGYTFTSNPGTYQIEKLPITANNVKIDLKKTSVPYTGKVHTFKVSDVTLSVAVDSNTKIDITDAFKQNSTFTGTDINIGKNNKLTILMNDLTNKVADTESAKEILSNFSYNWQANPITSGNSYEITTLNLNNCTGEITTEYTIDEFKVNPTVAATDIKLTTTDGETFTLSNLTGDVNIAVNQAAIDAANAGKTGVVPNAVTVSYKADTKNVTGSISLPITLTTRSLSSAIVYANVNGTAKQFETSTASNPGFHVTYNGKKYDLQNTSDVFDNFFISVDGKKLASGEYELSYDDNVNAGVVTVTITGKGSYAGSTKKVYFEIDKAKVAAGSLTVKDSVTINPSYNYDASLYKDAMQAKIETTLAGSKVALAEGTDYTVKYYYAKGDTYTTEDQIKANEGTNNVGQYVYVVATPVKDGNYTFTGNQLIKCSRISEKSISNVTVTVEKDTYTFTGKEIIPNVTVKDGSVTLDKGIDYTVNIKDNVDVGTATITIKPTVTSGYDVNTSATATFTIEAAKAEDVKVILEATASATAVTGKENTFNYTGRQVKPNVDKVELNGVDVTKYFDITYPVYGENIDAGKEAGSVMITPKTSPANFTGTKTQLFAIQGKELTGSLKAFYNDKSQVTVNNYMALNKSGDSYSFYYDGTEQTFANEVFSADEKFDVTEGTDYEIKYLNNVNAGYGFVAVIAKGNYEGLLNLNRGQAPWIGEYTLKDGKLTDTSTNTVVATNIVDIIAFHINPTVFTAKNITVVNGKYAGGMAVKPQVTVAVNGKTLTEGTDYELELWAVDGQSTPEKFTEVTTDKPYCVKVIPKGGYSFDSVNGTDTYLWGIDKKDLAECLVNVTKKDDKLELVVMNGNVVETKESFEVKDNEDGTATVSVVDGGKNYTGSTTVSINDTSEDTYVGQPIIKEVKVVGNKATVILEGETEEATGYDYVISTVNNYTDGRLSNGINKNQLTTQTSYQYLNQGIYYAYCHAWKRVNGVKVFSEWSNIMPFSVSSITPDQPSITKIEKSSNGKHLRVTWTKSANATGYDVVMGTKLQKVNGEYRPTEYGKAVKKITNGDTISVIFYNIPKGTYYVGLHAYNRTSETGVKVFSPWSNSKKVTF